MHLLNESSDFMIIDVVLITATTSAACCATGADIG
jgi:hypothetical protein